jgi:hypothetical protein
MDMVTQQRQSDQQKLQEIFHRLYALPRPVNNNHTPKIILSIPFSIIYKQSLLTSFQGGGQYISTTRDSASAPIRYR